ncbi:TPR-like protein [Pluteus cervinus]|uniref:TPR-like protein n=1 Tax=Pluteus cervinus TaxID=181527 RepID=A0ACD3AT71_9AGAR|nr:TPR-like protein [Pluteus cervinus]
MSHSHSHAPGENHSHSHAPPQQQQQQQPIPPPPDPALQALIDADFHAIDLATDPNSQIALCGKHSSEKCTECGVDYINLNRLSRLLVNNPNLRCPPPSNVVSQQLTQAINNTKNEGNVFFKNKQHKEAIARYTMAASISVQRPPWEANQFMREELSTVLSNRSASYCESSDYISALADAENVISIRRNWSKGHFRKAKALKGLGRPSEAADAIRLGLSFEPNNTELSDYLHEIERGIKSA